MVVVYRRVAAGLQFLVLHRAHADVGEEGDWAWCPPSGARFPGEPIETCARRELREEAGLSLPLRAAGDGPSEWCVYLAEASPQAVVRLSAEHDRHAWLPLEQAAERVAPQVVRQGLEDAARLVLDSGPAEA
jgi:8-oxo-dGTP pyrophosphatase MutT (NUDIX family)